MNDKNFLSEETRCSFFVSTKRKKIWKNQIDMLNVLSSVCKKFGLNYFAANGTLLGAVRHGGFIPWDDDMDIVMPRQDFNKLLSVASVEITYPYFLQTTLTDNNYYRNYARIRNSETTAIPVMDVGNICNNGVFIDIFPIDGCLRSRLNQINQRFQVLFYDRLLNNLYYYEYKLRTRYSLKSKIFHRFVSIFFNKNNGKNIFKKMEKIRSQREFAESDKVYTITHGNSFFVWEKQYFESSIMLDFEYIKIPVPVGFKSILESFYGDYMTFPAVEDRGKRHTIFFDPDKPYKEYSDLSYEKFYSSINIF
jgi:lipopolysaccharide cholinephosphotransferase